MKLSLVLFLFQVDGDLQRIAERVDRAAELKNESAEQERWEAEREALKAGTPILKHLSARFPGRKTVQLRPHCGLAKADPGFHHEVVRIMLLFKEAAVPHITRHVSSSDVEKRRMAAFALTRLPYASAVESLVSASGDPETSGWVRAALERSIFRRFETGEAYRTWYETHKGLARRDWLLEALTIKDLKPYSRRVALEAVPLLLPGRQGLYPLISALCDSRWEEARYPLKGLTGMVLSPARKAYGLTPEEREAERTAWRQFLELTPLEQDLEIAIHCLGDENFGYTRKGGEDELLRAHPEKALALIEREARRDPQIVNWRNRAFRHITTTKTYDGILQLLGQAENPDSKAEWILRYATHPALIPKILEQFSAGNAGPDNAFLESFPKLCRPEHVPAILRRVPGAREPIRRALLRGLGETGDPRALTTLKRELFLDPERAFESATALANFRGAEAVSELHILLRTESDPARALAARVLADKGDNSGVPILVGMLEKPDLSSPWFVVRCLAETTGLDVYHVNSDAWREDRPRFARLAANWWIGNKNRPRIEWLLDSLRNEGSHHNPLLVDLSEGFRELGQVYRGREFIEHREMLIRDWIENTGFRFHSDAGRVMYPK